MLVDWTERVGGPDGPIDYRATLTGHLLQVVSRYGGQQVVAGEAMQAMVDELADTVEFLGSKGYISTGGTAVSPAVVGTSTMPWSSWFHAEDPVMDGCCRLGHGIYGAENAISHEGVARELSRFLHARIAEQPPSSLSEALLSVVHMATRVATYLSCGERPIRQALNTLLRIALAYRHHPDYRAEWAPAVS